MNHKKMSLFVAAGLAATLLAVPVFAETAAEAPAENAPAQTQRKPRQSMFDRLETQLKLTDEQKATLHPIFTDADKQLNAIRKNKELSEDEKKSQRIAVIDALPEKVNPTLNDEQKTMFAKFVERMKNPPQRGDRGQRADRGNRQKPAQDQPAQDQPEQGGEE